MKTKLLALALLSLAWTGCGSDDPTSSAPNTNPQQSAYDPSVIKWQKLLSVDETYACGINKDGALKCWGDNTNGTLGTGTVTGSTKAKQVSILTSKVQSVSGRAESICATMDGKAYCWGQNNKGQIGNGVTATDTTPVTTPTPVRSLDSDVTSIASGGTFNCAVQKGAAKCWGDNSLGTIGKKDASSGSEDTPVQVTGLENNVVMIAAGVSHACALINDGSVQCWGQNDKGQLGNGNTIPSRVPVVVPGLSRVIEISAGRYHNCAIIDSGDVKCWGYNDSLRLGDGSTVAYRTSPVAVKDLSIKASFLAAGGGNTCAGSADGKMVCWGANGAGQLGAGSLTINNQPVVPVILVTDKIQAASTLVGTTCVLTTDNKAKCWGSNDLGQLGNNSTSATPIDSTAVDVIDF